MLHQNISTGLEQQYVNSPKEQRTPRKIDNHFRQDSRVHRLFPPGLQSSRQRIKRKGDSSLSLRFEQHGGRSENGGQKWRKIFRREQTKDVDSESGPVLAEA